MDLPDFTEASTPLGVFQVVLDMSLLEFQAVHPVFATWLWAVVVSGAWTVSPFLYLDIRLYQCGKAPIEGHLRDEPAD